MCPLCLATITGGLYAAGGVAAGALTTFVTAKLLRERPEPIASTAETEGDDHASKERNDA